MKRMVFAGLCSVLAVLAIHGGGEALAQTKANGLVIMATDYGADSIYVGALKGAMYTKNPDVRIDTLTNAIPAYDILAGAHALAEACAAFPMGTTFVCVVDPGVGTDRRCIVLETRKGQFFVAPDNGLLHLVADRFGIQEIREATNTAIWRSGEPSATFHGRDIFGPVAASIAGGAALEEVGPPLEAMLRLDVPGPRIEQNVVYGQVMRVDGYGNCITNIGQEEIDQLRLRSGDLLHIQAGEHHYTAPFADTYADVSAGQPLVVLQSNGLVELAINQGNLMERLALAHHAPVALAAAQTANPLPVEAGEEAPPAPSAQPEDSGPIVVVYERSGGLAGVQEELVVRRDGICSFNESGRRLGFNLDQSAIQELRHLLAGLPPPDELSESDPPRSGADFLSYRLTYHGQVYRATDLRMPDELAPVIARFNAILSKHRSSREAEE